MLEDELVQLKRILEIKSELRPFRGLRTSHRNDDGMLNHLEAWDSNQRKRFS